MSYLNITFQCAPAQTAIPTLFFDLFMPEANGDFVKVYLYLYRHSADTTPAISVSDIADTLYLTENDIVRALKYWQSKGLAALTFEQNQLTGIALLPIASYTADLPVASDISSVSSQEVSSCAQSQAAATVVSAKVQQPATYSLREDASIYAQAPPAFKKPQYTPKQITAFSNKHDGQQLFFIIQQYIGRPLNQTDINTIVFFHEELGFSTDLIEYLFEYCVSNNHRGFKYIEAVAISWAEEGIDTVSKAKNRDKLYSKTHYAVLRAFGITGRQPVQSEVDFINRWTDTYCMSSPLILEACSRTMAVLHTPNFEYTDRILKSWFDKKVTNLNDVKALDSAHIQSKKASESKSASARTAKDSRPAKASAPVNRFNNFNQRTYNYQELEQKLARKIQSGGAPK